MKRDTVADLAQQTTASFGAVCQPYPIVVDRWAIFRPSAQRW